MGIEHILSMFSDWVPWLLICESYGVYGIKHLKLGWLSYILNCMCFIYVLIGVISMNPITGSEFSLLRESFISFRAEFSQNVGTCMVKSSC